MKKEHGLWWILLAVFLTALATSCSTTHKTKSVTRTSVDSSSTVKIDSQTIKTIDSTTVKKDNSITTTEKQDDYSKVTVIEFDSSIKNSPADYFPPVKRITVTEKGVKKEIITEKANKSDSTRKIELTKNDLSKTVKTDLVKTETVKNKEVERTSYWGWLWLLLLIPAYLVYRNWDKIKIFLKIV